MISILRGQPRAAISATDRRNRARSPGSAILPSLLADVADRRGLVPAEISSCGAQFFCSSPHCGSAKSGVSTCRPGPSVLRYPWATKTALGDVF